MEPNAYVELMNKGMPFGSVAQKLLANGMNANALRTNATLRKDEWKQLDEVVLKASQERLRGVADLYRRGLTYDIQNGLGTTVLETETESDVQPAHLSMDGITRGERDRPNYELNYLPLPIAYGDFAFSSRVLAASRTRGQSLDTSTAELKGRKVSEKLEEMLFTNITYAFGGGTIYSYINHPNRNTGSLTAAWTASAADPLADLLAMKQASIAALHFGPWVLYIPDEYSTKLDENYTVNYPLSIRQRLLQVEGISDIVVADKLPTGNVVLVQMTSDVVRMVTGLPVTNVEWSVDGGMSFNFKVMTIQVPQIRADQSGNSGVVHYSA